MKIFRTDWFYAVSGGLMIIAGTATTGLISSSIRQEAMRADQEIAGLREELRVSEKESEISSMIISIASIQRSVIKYSQYQDPEIQSSWDASYAASVHVALVYAVSACSNSSNIERLGELSALAEKAKKGDKDSLSAMEKELVDLTGKAGEYRQSVVVKLADLEKGATSIFAKSELYDIVAVILQLLGMIILLIRDIPGEKLRKDA